MGERLDPESVRAVMSRYFDTMRRVLERHGGTVEKFIGDAVMAVFGIPALREDDALRAVRAADEMRAALAELNRELMIEWGVSIASRTGVNTGEVVAGDTATGATLATGDAVNVAARLEQSAQAGQILIGEPTFRLVRDAVLVDQVQPLALKGKSQALAAYQLVAVTPPTSTARISTVVPMVGRARELELLVEAFERARKEGQVHLVTVVGAPGVGKSRLLAEGLRAIDGDAVVLRGRCLSYGEGITYWPVAEAVRAAAGIEESDAPLGARSKIAALVGRREDAVRVVDAVAGAIGLTETPAEAAEMSWAIRTVFDTVAQARAVVLVLEDIHWAEPALLNLVEDLAHRAKGPLLIVCLARPELLESRQDWTAKIQGASIIRLEPLSARDSAELIHRVLGRMNLPNDGRDRISDVAAGNPLFVEELLAMLMEDGALRNDSGTWVPAADLTTMGIPPTISALLAARLDRLSRDERPVLETGSVMGLEFYRGALGELVPRELGPALGELLLALARRDLIGPGDSGFAGQEAFRFRHVLIRDAAYEALPKSTRAELHEGFGSWLEGILGDRLGSTKRSSATTWSRPSATGRSSAR